MTLGMHVEDQAITAAILRIRDGDIGGLAILVENFQIKAIRTAYLITGDKAAAEDIVQAAFIRVYARIHTFDTSRPFTPWFMKIVANGAIEACRKDKRLVSLNNTINHTDDDTFLDLLADDEHRPDTIAEDADLRKTVQHALEQLSPEQRAVIVLRYYLDMSEREMSDHLDTPTGTIKWRLHAARKKLSVLLRHLHRSADKSAAIKGVRNGR